MLMRRPMSKPNAPSALQKQGRLCVNLLGKPEGEHQPSCISFISFIPTPKSGQTGYLRSDSRNLGSLNEERRR